MSGMAGAWHDDTFFQMSATSGMMVSVAIPPGDDGSAVGRYFDEENRRFQAWLEQVLPPVRDHFASLGKARLVYKIPRGTDKGRRAHSLTAGAPPGELRILFYPRDAFSSENLEAVQALLDRLAQGS